MKIGSTYTNNMVNAYNKQKQVVKTEVANKTAKDSVVISDSAKYLNKINSDSEGLNLEKINEIKSRIKNGTYSISSRDIAKKMVDSIEGE